MLCAGAMSAQETPRLTIGGETYDVVASAMLNNLNSYDQGRAAGIIEGQQRGSQYTFTSTPTLVIRAVTQFGVTDGEMFLSYETNLPYRLNNQINEPLVRIIYRNSGQYSTSRGEILHLLPAPFDVRSFSSAQPIELELDLDPASRNLWFDILIIDADNNIVRMNGLPITYE